MKILHPTFVGSLAVFAAGLCLASVADAQECIPPRILLVVDASSSMRTTIELSDPPVTKWEAAQGAVQEVLSTYPDGAQYGLMTFPGQSSGCDMGEVVVDVGPGTATDIGQAMVTLLPPLTGSYTPAGQSLMVASQYAGLLDPLYPSYTIFVTDGWQWCSENADTTCVTQADCTFMGVTPCPTCNPGTDGCYCVQDWPELGAQALSNAGVSTFVVGFGQSVNFSALNQTAVAGGTALPNCDPSSQQASCYFQATQPAELTGALSTIVQALVTEDCQGPCQIPGLRTCTAAGWSECDSPSEISCTSTCNTPGTQQCVNGQLTECSSEAQCGAGGAGGFGGTLPAGGSGPAGGTGPSGGSGPSGGAGVSDDPEAEGNCGCRLLGQPSASPPFGVALLGLAAVVAARRRRAR
jgi:MYXO-CTERM domain-containing protein